MVLWDSLLPVAVERARQTYTHTAECQYTRRAGACRTLCSCGEGKDLPSAFEESMKQVNAPGSAVHPLFYRAALSPLFKPAEAFSEEIGGANIFRRRVREVREVWDGRKGLDEVLALPQGRILL